MDYIGIECPACKKAFTQNDDIVVCPECGTPHHRDCYELNNQCINHSKHNDDFTFTYEEKNNANDSSESNNKADNDILCPRCKASNPKDMFFCGKCGFPLNMTSTNSTQQNANNRQFNASEFAFDPFDPMAGIAPETDMGEDVTAGEVAKFVQNNTSYFLRVFSNIKNNNRGKFSFVGFLFGGGYLLYRKMYKKGIFLTLITAVLLIMETLLCLTPQYNDLLITLNEMSKNMPSLYSAEFTSFYMDFFQNLDLSSILILAFIYLSAGIQIAIKIVVAINANKWYFKHCKKKITKIKCNKKLNIDSEKESDVNSELENKGGVNKGLALSLLAVSLVISYLPMFL